MIMQTNIAKIFIINWSLVAISLITKASAPEIFFKADSLFKQNSYVEALKYYEAELSSSRSGTSPAVLLKVAFIAERFGDIPKAIFYLSKYNQTFPSTLVSSKIGELAENEGYSGYQKNDLTNILTFIAAYYFYIIMVFVLIGFGMFYILFNKFSKNQQFLKRHSAILFLYLAGLIFIVNSPLGIRNVIVKSSAAELRSEPSSASQALQNVNAGDKLDYLGEVDIWNRVKVENKIYFINQNSCWELE
jgi:tetratricopeptide (TPR) repeat protein